MAQDAQDEWSWLDIVVRDARPDSSAAGDIFVLGAGFSRAVSQMMPLTDELGNACLSQVSNWSKEGVDEPFRGGRFETFLSELASDQPFLSDIENLHNKARFASFSEAIAAIIGDKQQRVLRTAPPDWLVSFVTTAHQRRSTLLTFNYDCLVECVAAYQPALLTPASEDLQAHVNIDWNGVLTGDLPPWPPGPGRFGGSPLNTLRLLKLHGSTNWYWTPGDAAGASVARRALPGAYGTPRPYQEGERARLLPGRVPLLVPPTAAKSSYFAVPMIHEVWRQAAEQLRSASRVFFLGYSLPPTDLTTTALLRSNLDLHRVDVFIADRNPAPVGDRLEAIGLARSQIHPIREAHKPIQHLTRIWAEHASARLLAELHELVLEPSRPVRGLVVSWGNSAHARVTAVHVQDGQVRLETQPPVDSLSRATHDKPGDMYPPPEPVPTRALFASGPPQPGPMFVMTPGGGLRLLVGRTEHAQLSGLGNGLWEVLYSAGPAPQTA